MPDLTMQNKVDICQALLELDELRDAGLISAPGNFNRESSLRFLAAAKRQGVIPGDGRFAIGRGFLERIGGEFLKDFEGPLESENSNA